MPGQCGFHPLTVLASAELASRLHAPLISMALPCISLTLPTWPAAFALTSLQIDFSPVRK